MQLFKPSWVSHGGNPLMSIDIHPDRSRFATGGQDGDAGRVTIWSMVPLLQADAETSENVPKMLCQMDNHLACVNAVRWSTAGRYLASGGDDKLVMIWQMARESHSFGSSRFERNTECWRVVTVLSGHQGDVLDLSWSSRDEYLASCSVDNNIIIWNARKWGEKVTVLKGHSSMVKGVSWDPVGKYLASQSDDKTVMIWRCMDWQCHKVISKPFESTAGSTHMLRLHWSPDGQLLVSAHAKNGRFPTAQMIKRDGDLYYDFVGHRKAVTCVRFCPQILVDPTDEPSNGMLADPAKQGAINGVHVDGEEKRKKKRGSSKEFMCCALGSRDHGISIWITKLGRPRVVVGSLFSDSVTDLAWSRTGQELMACSWDGSVAFMSFAADELGRPVTPEAKKVLMKQLYGNFGIDDLDGMQSSLKSAILENPDLHVSGIANKFLDGFQSSPSETWSNATDTPSKPVIRGPIDKQIETRTKDGRRRITPVYIPLTAASPPPGESITTAFGSTDGFSKKVELNGLVQPESSTDAKDPCEEPVADKESEELTAETAIEEPVEETASEEPGAETAIEEPVTEKVEAMEIDDLAEPVKEGQVEDQEESSSDSSSSSGSSSSSSGSSSSSSSSESEAEESGEDGSGDESEESADEAPQQEVAAKEEEKPEKQEGEESSDSEGSSSSGSESSDEEMEDQSAKPETVVETVEEEGGEEEEAEEEGDEEGSSSEGSSEDSGEEDEERKAESPAPGEPAPKRRKVESSEESSEEVQEDEHGNRAPSPRYLPKLPPQQPKPPAEKPAAKPDAEDDRFVRRIGSSETVPQAGGPTGTTRAPAAPAGPHSERKPEPVIPKGADKFSARFPTMSPNPDVTVHVNNEAYVSNGVAMHQIACRPRQGLHTWQPWNAILSSRVTHIGLERKFFAAATIDGMLHCFRVQTGEYVVSPLALKGPVAKMVTSGDIVALVTYGAEFSMWDFSLLKNIQRCDVAFLMSGNPRPYVTMLSLFRQEIPIIGLSSGKAYLYKRDLQSWVLLLDSSDAARDLVHPSAIRGTVGPAMGQRRAWGFDTGVTPPLLTIQEQLKRNLGSSNKGFKGPSEAHQSATLTYLQAQVAAAKDMGSPTDYWESFMTLTRYYVQNAMETQLRLILHDLMGPVHGGKSALEWKEEVVSNKKRDMLVHVMDMLRSNVNLQRLHGEYSEMMKVIDLPRPGNVVSAAATTTMPSPSLMVNGPSFPKLAALQADKPAEDATNGDDPTSVHA